MKAIPVIRAVEDGRYWANRCGDATSGHAAFCLSRNDMFLMRDISCAAVHKWPSGENTALAIGSSFHFGSTMGSPSKVRVQMDSSLESSSAAHQKHVDLPMVVCPCVTERRPS